MKYLNSHSIFLILSLFSLISCSQVSHRRPSSLSNSELADQMAKRAARYLLMHEPKLLGNHQELISDLPELYRLMGLSDVNKLRQVTSQITSRDEAYKEAFRLNSAKQIPYAQWQDLEEDVLKTYQAGKYVFRKGRNFYTLWGTKLTLRNINPGLFKHMKAFNTKYDPNKLALALFNQEGAFILGDNQIITLPDLSFVYPRDQRRLLSDYIEQTEGQTMDIFELLNYSPYWSKVEHGEYEDYFAKKNELLRYGEIIEDYDTPCTSHYYFKGLSKRSIPRTFVQTLFEHKESLMKELRLSNNEYDELVILSLGILSVESKMGRSFKYILKEDIKVGKVNLGQLGIRLLKKLKGRDDENSRGLTQIKDIGPLLEDTRYAYLTDSDLDDPQNAALATMFVLREKLGYLKHFKSRHNNITTSNWADYLYYFYQGSSGQITKGEATPPLNLRIQEILKLKDNAIILRSCQ